MNIKCVPFYDLSLDELYAIMVLRQEVFVLEQNCPFVDADGKDQFGGGVVTEVRLADFQPKAFRPLTVSTPNQ